MSESDIPLQTTAGEESLHFHIGRDAVVNPQVHSKGIAAAALRRIFSFPAMLAGLLVGAVFAVGRLFHVDPDLWWHVKVGGAILTTHRWPTTDSYSFTVSGQPWLAYEWLGDVLLAAVNRAGGLRGLDILLIVIGSGVVLALYAFTTLTSGNSKAGFVATTMLLILATASFSMRPQMIGYLFLILTLIALERFRQGKAGTLWLLPVLMVLWVNTHGSWIIGLGAIFVYWMSGLVEFRLGGLEAKRWTADERCTISAVFLLCLVALPITPYGVRIAASPFEFAFSLPLNVQYINEWQPMPFNMAGGKLFLGLLLGAILIHVIYQFRWRLEQLGLFLFGAMLACLHVRFLLVFVPFAAPILAATVARWIPRFDPNKDKLWLNSVLMASVAAGIVYYLPSRAELQQDVSSQFPVAAVEYLDQHSVAGPMFNNYGFGGYLVWARGPEHKVFIDGRGDVYERGGVLSDYLHISHLQPAALSVLDSYGVNSCLVARDEPLATLLSASQEWQRVYVDNLTALFVNKHGDGMPR